MQYLMPTVSFAPCVIKRQLFWPVGDGAIGGPLAHHAVVLERIEGSYANVVGLPVALVDRFVRELEADSEGTRRPRARLGPRLSALALTNRIMVCI